MKRKLNWAFFGSSLVSESSEAASYYRGLLRALAARGHQIEFFEPDTFERQQNRDIPDPEWAKIHVFAPSSGGLSAALDRAANADIIVKASGVGVLDEELEKAVASELKHDDNLAIFWDVDAPATLDRMGSDLGDPFRSMVPRYDLIMTYGGGDRVVEKYRRFGARLCIPIYNALDRSTHFRVHQDRRFSGSLGFLGNRLPDREKRVEDFFLRAVKKLPKDRFLLGGDGWADKTLPQNVHYLGNVYRHEHNAFNSSVKAVLALNRANMTTYGGSPPTRIFEAAGAAACIITDLWEGVEFFLEPGKEVLVANDGEQLAEIVRVLSTTEARNIGKAALRRICAQHTYEHRAAEVEFVLRHQVGFI